MGFSEELKIMIKTVFDNKGMKKAASSMKSLSNLSKKSLIGKLPKTSLDDMMVLDKRKIGKKIKDATKGIDEVAKSYQDMGNKIKKPIEQTTSSFKDFGKESTAAFEAKKYQVFLDQNKRLKQFGFQVKEGGQVVDKFGKALNKTQRQELISPQTAADFETFNKQLYQTPKNLRKTGLGLKAYRGQFKMYLLSIMFFGMQIQRIFSRIVKTTLMTYMKISEGTTQAGQGINMLQAAFTTLKYVVGEAISSALEPLLPLIMNLMMGMIDWVEKNQKLTGWLVGIGLAIGGILFGTAQFGLGMLGLKALVIDIAPKFTIWGKSIATFLGKSKGINDLVGTLGKNLKLLKNIGGVLIGIGVVIWGAKTLINAIKNSDVWGMVKGSLITALGISTITFFAGGGFGLAGPVFLISASVLLLLSFALSALKISANLEKARKEMALKETLGDIFGISEGKIQWSGKGSIIIPLGLKIIWSPFYYFDRVKHQEQLQAISNQQKAFAEKTDIDLALDLWSSAKSSGMDAKDFADNYAHSMGKIIDVAKSIPAGEVWLEDLGFGEVGKNLLKGIREELSETAEIINNFSEYEAVSFVNEADIGHLEDLKEKVDELIPSLSGFSKILSGTKEGGEGKGTQGLLITFQLLKDKMEEVGQFIVDTFIGQISSSQSALRNDSEAAYLAAYWQAYYNKAKEGEITSVPTYTSTV